MGLLTQDDSLVFRSWFEEMAKLHGISVGYQYPLGDKKTIHSEPNMPMSNPISLDIVFNENPTLDTLKKHGWVSEIGEQKPVVAQVPYDTPNLQRYSRIIIPPIGTIVDARIFEVTAISTIMEYPDCWTVRLAPIYKTIQETNDLSNANVTTIDVNSKGSQDSNYGHSKQYLEYEKPKVTPVEDIEIETKDIRLKVNEEEILDNTTVNVNNILGKDYNTFDD